MSNFLMANNEDRGVGIAGFKTPGEANYLSRYFREQITRTIDSKVRSACDPSYLDPLPGHLMLGVLTSEKRLKDKFSFGKRSPALDGISEIFRNIFSYDCVTPVLHYYTTDVSSIGDQVTRLFNNEHVYEDQLCTTVQLNAAWPDPSQIELMRNRMPELKVVLQLPKRATDGMSERQIVKRVCSYDALASVDYVLIDGSGGNGIPMDQEKTLKLAKRLQRNLFRERVGLAGGLDANSLEDLIPKANKVLERSYYIDAEGKLMQEDGSNLSMDKCKAYIDAALRLM